MKVGVGARIGDGALVLRDSTLRGDTFIELTKKLIPIKFPLFCQEFVVQGLPGFFRTSIEGAFVVVTHIWEDADAHSHCVVRAGQPNPDDHIAKLIIDYCNNWQKTLNSTISYERG